MSGSAARFTSATLGTPRLGTALGRANMYLGAALLLNDAAAIEACVNAEMGGGGRGGGGGATGSW
jgi:hypothetical protein